MPPLSCNHPHTAQGLGFRTAFAAMAFALLLAGCREQAASSAIVPSPVRVMTVTPEELVQNRTFTGTIQPRTETAYSFRIGGKIVERLVDVGEPIRQGQLIARLDDTDLMLQLRAAESDVRAAETSVNTAEANLKRQQKLKRGGWVSQARLDDAVAGAQEAATRLERSRRALSILTNQVSYTRLIAGHDGIVTRVTAETGEVVSMGQPVAQIAGTEELEVVIGVPEQQIEDVKSSKAEFTLWDTTDEPFDIRLREVAGDANPQTRLFDFRYSILRPDARMSLGRSVTVAIEKRPQGSVFRLPMSAVMNDARGPMVWVLDASGERIARRAVTVKAYGQDSVLVSNGLAPQERIVTLGVHQLDENMPVRVVEQISSASQTQLRPETQ